jgi:hypothetical protein
LKSNLIIRQNGPQIFSNRDLASSEIRTALKLGQFCPMPKLTKDNKRVIIARNTTTDTSDYNYVDCIKAMLMILDARYVMFDEDEKLAESDILIIDMKFYTYKHFLGLMKNPKTTFLYFKYIQETVPIATLGAHFINPSGIVERVMSIIRPFLRKEVAESFRFHSDGFESLHKVVPKEVLPIEYGGELGAIDEIYEKYLTSIESKR